MDNPILKMATRHLSKADKTLAKLIKLCDPIILSKTTPPYYHALVSAIINQQLSVKAGRTIEKRLQTIHGGRYFKAESLLKLKAAAIRECGLSNKKVLYVRTLAQAIIHGELSFRSLVKQDNNQIRNTLTQFPGIGPWSADMFLISSLRRADIFPVGDLVIRQAMQSHYNIDQNAKYDSYINIAEAWKPYRSIASLYLWKSKQLSFC